jgi:YVTN family beta-propeller protein
VTHSQTTTQDTGTLRLGYEFVPSPTPILASASGANPNTFSLQVIISNPGDAVVTISRVRITIPTGGSDPGQISTTTSLPDPTYDDTANLWDIASSGSTVGITPTSGQPTQLGDPIVFTLQNIAVNEQPGTVFLGIVEQTPQATATIANDNAWTLHKQPSDYPVTSFSATPAALNDIDEPIVLTWTCSDQGELVDYSLSSQSDAEATLRADHAKGQGGADSAAAGTLQDFRFKDCVDDGDCYTWQDGQTGVTVPKVAATTTYTLSQVVTDSNGGREVSPVASTTVRVNAPSIAGNSRIATSPTGRLVNLYWLASNAGRCSIQLDNIEIVPSAPIDTYHSGYFLYVDGPLRSHQFTVVAHAVIGTAVYQDPLSLFDLRDPTPITIGQASQQFGSLAFTRDATAVFIANPAANAVTVIDVARQQAESATIPVGHGPGKVVMSPEGSRAFVVSETDGIVSILDVAGRKNTGLTIAQPDVVAAAIQPDGALAWTMNGNAHLDSHALPGAASLAARPASPSTVDNLTGAGGFRGIDFIFSADGTLALQLLMNNGNSIGYLLAYSMPGLKLLGNPVLLGKHPTAIAVTPDNALALVSNAQSSTVSVVDIASSTVVRSIPVGAGPNSIAITPDGSRALVACTGDTNLTVIDIPARTTAQIPLGRKAAAIGLAPDGSAGLVISGDGTATGLFI